MAEDVQGSTERDDLYGSDGALDNPDLDGLRRWPFAQRVAQTIASRRDPASIVVGIYGAWGDGKTTVLNFIRRELETQGAVPIWFNPWRFPDEDTLLRSFFTVLAEHLDTRLLPSGHGLGATLRKYAFLGQSLRMDQTIAGLGNLLADETPEKLKEHVNEVLVGEKRRVVLLVDDIDRMSRDEIFALFRLVKLTADFAYTSYVLAFDEQLIASSIGEQFGAGNRQAGSEFLEKIVQVPLFLPKADPISLLQICYDGINRALSHAALELSEQQVTEFTRRFEDGLQVALRTPRLAHRYANALVFALPILKDEVHPVDHMLVEGLRIFYPSLYDAIRHSPEMVLGGPFDSVRRDEARRERNDAIDAALSELASEERDSARRLLHALFPQTRFGSASAQTERRWEEERRVAARSYFERYFAYAIPEGDVSDRRLDNVVEMATTDTPENIAEQIRSLMGPRSSERLIQQLRLRTNAIPAEAAGTLAKALALLGEEIPDPPGSLGFGARNQAGILVADLLRKIASRIARHDVATAIVSLTSSLQFACTVLRWLRFEDEDEGSELLFTRAQERDLGRIVADRIAAVARDSAFYLQTGRSTPSMLYYWAEYRGYRPVRRYLRDTFQGDPVNVIEFIKCWMPVTNGDPAIYEPRDLRLDRYQEMKKYADTDVMYQVLRQRYGISVDREAEYGGVLDEQFARAFALCRRLDQRATSPGERVRSGRVVQDEELPFIDAAEDEE